MLTTPTTNLLISALLVWSLGQHAADGRYVDADDFAELAAEVATVKEERLVFNERITELEMKLDARDAKLKVVERKLSVTETKVAGTEEKLRIVEDQLNDALSRIEELKRNSKLSRDQEELANKETYEDDPDRETNKHIKVATKAQIKKTDGTRDATAVDKRNMSSLSRRIVPTTMPHIAFSTYLNVDLTGLGTQHMIKFDGVNLNEGNGYDDIMGVFICPVSGIYVFQSALMALHEDSIQTEIVKDGAPLVRLYTAGSTASNGHDQGFNSVVTTCNQGEHIWVRKRDNTGSAVFGLRFSTFSGYLLWEN